MSSRRRFRRDFADVSSRVRRYLPTGPAADLVRLQTAWAQMVGPDVAHQSIVVRRSRAGVVTVACASAAWAQELDGRRDRYAAALAREVGGEPTVSAIRLVVGDHVMPAEPAVSRPAPVVTPDDVAAADAVTPPIDDPVLRDLLVRAQAAQAALHRQRKDLQRADKPRRDGRNS